MRRMLRILGAALAVAALVAVGITGSALAAGPEAAGPQAGVDDANQYTWRHCCSHFWGLRACGESVSDLLGLSPAEIIEQRHAGMSLVEIAAAQGVDEETLAQTIVLARQEALQQMVAEGTLTQEQADQALERTQARLPDALNRAGYGPHADRSGNSWGEPGDGSGPGLAKQWGAQSGPGAVFGDPAGCTGPGDMHQRGRGQR